MSTPRFTRSTKTVHKTSKIIYNYIVNMLYPHAHVHTHTHTHTHKECNMEGGRGRRAPKKISECESLVVVLFVDYCKGVARVDHFYVKQDRRVTHGSSVPLTSAAFFFPLTSASFFFSLFFFFF